jgi:hypothetical protein
MKKNTIIYWTSTGIISLIMLFSIYMMYSPLYKHLGFPDYFRVELLVFKIIGLLVLLIPQVPLRIKEWAYAGFGIVLVSACVAHFNSGDGVVNALEPLIWFGILATSNWYLYKTSQKDK